MLSAQNEYQKCGQCDIKCWDLTIFTPKPVSGSDSVAWKQLHCDSECYVRNLLGKESPEGITILPA